MLKRDQCDKIGMTIYGTTKLKKEKEKKNGKGNKIRRVFKYFLSSFHGCCLDTK